MEKKSKPPGSESPAPVYSFPNKSRCPRCGSVQTEAYGSQEGTQYRRCRMAACRHRYKVAGETV